MQSLIVLPRRVYSGEQSFGAVSIPTGIALLAFTIDRTEWLDSTVTVSVQIDLSRDGGATWQSPYVGFTAQGGIVLQPQTGLPLAETQITVPLPDAMNPARRLRGIVSITGSFRTTGTVVLS